jgi:hypothetical protein
MGFIFYCQPLSAETLFLRAGRGFEVKSLEVLRTQTRLHQMNLLVQLELCEHVSGTGGRSVVLITVHLSFRVIIPRLEFLVIGIALTCNWPRCEHLLAVRSDIQV